jgi:hypothetical protein
MISNSEVGENFWTGSVIDNKKGTAGRKKSVRMPENIVHVQEELTCSPSKHANVCLNSYIKVNVHFNHCSARLKYVPLQNLNATVPD